VTANCLPVCPALPGVPGAGVSSPTVTSSTAPPPPRFCSTDRQSDRHGFFHQPSSVDDDDPISHGRLWNGTL
jgi:hypothetical protein